MAFKHFFLPHPDTHKKAHLISWEAILTYILLFIFLQVSFNIFANFKPGVLGVNSNIDQQKLIQLTNEERAKQNLPLLTENNLLDQAAAAKAQNMFEENYWAHYSPSGKDPWGFIRDSGYKFSSAGENLARNFYTSDEVINAWMASPSHKENIINSKYNEIGIAVVDGVLNGQQTTLVVQMFGTPTSPPLAKASDTSSQQNISPENTNSQNVSEVAQIPNTFVASEKITIPIEASSIIDSHSVIRSLGLGIILFVGSLLVIDIYIMKKRGVYRLSSSHIPHLALLGLAVGALVTGSPGMIL